VPEGGGNPPTAEEEDQVAHSDRPSPDAGNPMNL
jgi:hypothetical protein